VTIQAQILDLMRKLQAEIGMAILFITHNLGVVAEMADRVVVLYGGRVVETGPLAAVFRNPRHPYTRGLMASVPGSPFRTRDATGRLRLTAIPG
ncbi:ABC transporter ATP-binding protein, partial [Mycobacterium tuberculosis]|nr:ABC transporter ATP-binding protein [Mycobacterium tuberculosis]